MTIEQPIPRLGTLTPCRGRGVFWYAQAQELIFTSDIVGECS